MKTAQGCRTFVLAHDLCVVWRCRDHDRSGSVAFRSGLRCRAALIGLLLPIVAGLWNVRAGEPPQAGNGVAILGRAGEDRIRALIAQLDAAAFVSREQASLELASQGISVVPHLVAALGEPSSELRFRAHLLLLQHSTFEEVIPYLLSAVETPYGDRARVILQERAVLHVDEASQPPYAEKLFKFWGTDLETYRHQAMTRLLDAKDRAGTMQALQPLLGLRDKTTRFSDVVSRLESLSLPHDHQHSPGFVIVQTLARGLRENHAGWVSFAEQYLASFEALVVALQQRQAPKHSIRQELSDRANMSQGAASFLVQILDETAALRMVVTGQIGLPVEHLRNSFLQGLASADPREYDRGIGRVHIVDMLTEELGQWPEIPRAGVAAELIASVTRSALAGDKPKALSYLDALEACRELPAHRLSVTEGLGKQLGEQLFLAATEAPNNRAYNPTRSLHDRIITLIDRGVLPEHSAFPGQLLQEHLRGAAEVTSDEQRLALDRYLRVLDRLQAAGVRLDQPGAGRFVRTLRDGLTTRHDLLATSAAQLDQILGQRPSPDRSLEAKNIDQALSQWIHQVADR